MECVVDAVSCRSGEKGEVLRSRAVWRGIWVDQDRLVRQTGLCGGCAQHCRGAYGGQHGAVRVRIGTRGTCIECWASWSSTYLLQQRYLVLYMGKHLGIVGCE